MGPPRGIDPMTHHTMCGHSTTELHITPKHIQNHIDGFITFGKGYTSTKYNLQGDSVKKGFKTFVLWFSDKGQCSTGKGDVNTVPSTQLS